MCDLQETYFHWLTGTVNLRSRINCANSKDFTLSKCVGSPHLVAAMVGQHIT